MDKVSAEVPWGDIPKHFPNYSMCIVLFSANPLCDNGLGNTKLQILASKHKVSIYVGSCSGLLDCFQEMLTIPLASIIFILNIK